MHPLLSRPEHFMIPKLGLAVEHLRLATMVYVQGGTFRMGSAKDDPDAFVWEKPDHDVSLPSFFIGQVPVTQALWKAVMNGDDPSFFKGDERPVEQVSWHRITKEFLPALETLTGIAFRLPTEAEWEYAAPHTETYSGSNKLKEVAWFSGNSHNETKPVGLKLPNALGLYDMSGNVWEWVEDDWHDNYKKAPKDGAAWIDKKRGVGRVIRGGGCFDPPQFCRVAYRNGDLPALGYRTYSFRLAASFQADDLSRAANR